ncbi:glucan endo-1,3-beta-glucosidase-like [Chenopodium quinoa]|uniref:Glucan endo-1,3-beta-D-glucosidase n=1 Tax=Chenopodium quinoa TaxID=63459 RepID=A0A803MXE3_CHEQI|nr:glucan endo-1,3-beta-glucosidase-like [Chenopodium quinoa]
MAATAMLLLVMVYLFLNVHHTVGQVGVCYGNVADNLPSEQDVINLYKSNGIETMRLFNPNTAALQALQGSGIKTILGVVNGDLSGIASDPAAATNWVQTNVVPFASAIKYIAVGNEIHPDYAEAPAVLPAMQNILNALVANGLGGQILVSTAIDTSLFTNTYPPSASEFSNPGYITPIINFLTTNGSPLLVNIYPYFARISDPENIRLDYALFTAPGPVFSDSGRDYQNLFDAIVDGVFVALGKAGAPNVGVVVSETGWPSEGGADATVDNAGTYYRNAIGHVKQGTPLKPGGIETYLFAMFDEDNKPGAPSEHHFGLFTPNQQPKYGALNFNP